ncbi:hypothetical protein BgiMline_031702 [Biomphalaria glabrata]|nr:3-3aS; 4S; 7aS-7a-methyl-1; 5-dioxo-octahydro-1H-inden-4-yl ligase-like [Biomphalaria glabrata]
MNSTEQVPVWEPRDTVNECTVSLAEMFPDKELFVFYHKGQRDSYTALTLYKLAGRFADRLRRYGFQRQDVIANTLPNSPERVITDLGIILAGCITMNLQHLLVDGSDLYHTARKSGCKCVIMSDNEQCPTWQLLKPYIAGDTDNFITSISIDHTPEMTSSIVVTRNRTGPRKPLLEDLTNSDEEVFVDKVSPSDLAVIFGTSGSTGYSKLVPRTHADTVNCLLMRDVAWFRKTYGQSVKITMYSDRLLGWIGGFSFYSTVAAVTRVLKDSYTLDESTTSQDFWDAVTNEDCTFAIMAPLEVDKRITHITSSGGVFPKKLKYIIVIGQPMTKEQVKKMFLLSESVVVAYGSTEVSSIAGITVQGI